MSGRANSRSFRTRHASAVASNASGSRASSASTGRSRSCGSATAGRSTGTPTSPKPVAWLRSPLLRGGCLASDFEDRDAARFVDGLTERTKLGVAEILVGVPLERAKLNVPDSVALEKNARTLRLVRLVDLAHVVGDRADLAVARLDLLLRKRFGGRCGVEPPAPLVRQPVDGGDASGKCAHPSKVLVRVAGRLKYDRPLSDGVAHEFDRLVVTGAFATHECHAVKSLIEPLTGREPVELAQCLVRIEERREDRDRDRDLRDLGAESGRERRGLARDAAGALRQRQRQEHDTGDRQ